MAGPVKKRQPGLRIRPGSVREAREEAGLSLGKVAGTELSRTAIFLIEKGRARPTMPTLELIASRTGKPLDFFLEDGAENVARLQEYLVDELERLIAQQRCQEALTRAAELLGRSPAREDAARVRTLMGQAYIRLFQPDQATDVVAPAKRFYELTGNKWMLVECQATEVAARIQREDPNALQAAWDALDLCRSLRPLPVDLEIRMLQRVAIAHMQRHEWEPAIAAFQEGLDKAGDFQDLTQLAVYYGELATAYQETGQAELATRYSRRSIALFELVSSTQGMAGAENNLGLALTKLGDHSGAERHLSHSLELAGGVPRLKTHVLLSMAELRLAQGRFDDAIEACLQGIELAAELGQEATVAEGRLWLGRIFEAKGDASGADREFKAAIEVLGRLQLLERATRAHAAYAEILEQRGDIAAAHKHLKLAFAGTRPDLTRREVADTGLISQLA